MQNLLQLFSNLFAFVLNYLPKRSTRNKNKRDPSPYEILMNNISYLLNVRLEYIPEFSDENRDIKIIAGHMLVSLRKEIVALNSVDVEVLCHSDLYRMVVHKTNDAIGIGEGNARLDSASEQNIRKIKKVYASNLAFFLKSVELLFSFEEYTKEEQLDIVYILLIAMLTISSSEVEKMVVQSLQS